MTIPVLLFTIILAAALSMTAFVMALVIPVSRPVLRRLLPSVFVLAVFILFLAASGTAYLLWLERIRPLWLFPMTAIFTAAYLVGALAIMMLGNRTAKKADPTKYWPKFRLLGLAFIITGLAFFVYLQAEAYYSRAMAETRVAATQDAVRLLPMIPKNGENARLLYDEAFKAMRQSEVAAKAALSTDPSSPEALERLTKLGPVMAGIRRAAGVPDYSEDLDERNLLASPARNYRFIHALAGLVAFSARAKAASGDIGDAWRDVETLDRMVDHFRRTPIPISLIVASTLERYRAETVEYVLNKAGARPESLPDLPLTAPDGIFQDDLVRVVGFEQAALVQYVSCIGAKGYPSFSDAIKLATVEAEGRDRFAETLLPLVKYYWPLFMQPADVQSAREVMALVGANVGATYGDYNKSMPGVNQYFETRPNGIGLASSLMVPNYFALVRQVAQARARRGTTVLAMACKAFQWDNGRYPKTTDELVPKYLKTIPTDPIDGRPFKLESGLEGVYVHCAVTEGIPEIGIRLAN